MMIALIIIVSLLLVMILITNEQHEKRTILFLLGPSKVDHPMLPDDLYRPKKMSIDLGESSEFVYNYASTVASLRIKYPNNNKAEIKKIVISGLEITDDDNLLNEFIALYDRVFDISTTIIEDLKRMRNRKK